MAAFLLEDVKKPLFQEAGINSVKKLMVEIGLKTPPRTPSRAFRNLRAQFGVPQKNNICVMKAPHRKNAGPRPSKR